MPYLFTYLTLALQAGGG